MTQALKSGYKNLLILTQNSFKMLDALYLSHKKNFLNVKKRDPFF